MCADGGTIAICEASRRRRVAFFSLLHVFPVCCSINDISVRENRSSRKRICYIDVSKDTAVHLNTLKIQLRDYKFVSPNLDL